MIVPNETIRAASHLLLLAAALITTGCQSARPVSRVTSPPPPRFGSAPLAAYDEYALALQRQTAALRGETLASTYLR